MNQQCVNVAAGDALSPLFFSIFLHLLIKHLLFLLLVQLEQCTHCMSPTQSDAMMQLNLGSNDDWHCLGGPR